MQALEVQTMPDSEYDWQVASALAEIAERQFLRQISVVFLGQRVRLQLTPSMSVTLVIVSIKTSTREKSHNSSRAIGQHSESGSDSSQKFSGKLHGSSNKSGALDNSNIYADIDDDADFLAARLSVKTTLTVSPYNASALNKSLTPSAGDEGSVMSDVVSSSGATEGRPLLNKAAMQKRGKELRTVVNRLPPLRVLPQCFRDADCDSSYHVYGVTEQDPYDSVNIKDSKQDMRSNTALDIDLMNDNSTAYIHPIHLLAAQEILSRKTFSEQSRGAQDFLLSSDIDPAWNYNGDFGCLVSVSPVNSGDKAVRPVADAVVMRVKLTTKVRTFHVSLPRNVQKCLLSGDFDLVTLRFLDDCDCRPIRPSQLSLNRISWQDLPHPDAASISSTQSRLDRGHGPEAGTGGAGEPTVGDRMPMELTQAILRAFSRYVRHDISINGTCYISHGSVVTLSVPSDTWRGGRKLRTCGRQVQSLGVAPDVVEEDFLVSLHTPQHGQIKNNARKGLGHGKDIVLPALLQLSAVNGEEDLQSILEDAEVISSKAITVPTDLLRCLRGDDDSVSPAGVVLHEKVELSPEGMDAVVREMLTECCLSLLPRAVFERIQAGVGGPTGILVTGSAGTGKTELLRYIGRVLQRCPTIASFVKEVPCAGLRGLPMQQVLTILSSAFEEVSAKTPSVLLLDDIDALCPKKSDDAAAEVANKQAAIISLHIEGLMRDLVQKREKSHRTAYALYQVIFSSCKDMEGGIGNVGQSHVQRGFGAERVSGRALHDTVFIIATAQSSDIDSRLISPDFLHRSIPIPPLRDEDRLKALCGALHRLGARLEDVSKEDMNRLYQCTDGYRVGDLMALARQCAVNVVRDDARTSADTMPPYVINSRDIISTAQSFSPLSSSLCTTSSSQSKPTVGWEDIGGLADAIRELKSTFQLPLLYRKLYQRSPVKIPRGVLLYGPPGCGKTILAEAAGKECGMTFIPVKGPQLLDKYIGGSERAMRELFDRARSSGRVCLIFFDEFEAVAPKRGSENSGVTDRVVNQLLTFLDGVEDTLGSDVSGAEGRGQVYVLAATSRPDMVDTALLRPGRIEKHVYVGLPSIPEREKILRVALKSTKCADDIYENLTAYAGDVRMDSMTGADIRGLVNTAVLLAIHECIDARAGHMSEHIRTLDLYGDDGSAGVDREASASESLLLDSMIASQSPAASHRLEPPVSGSTAPSNNDNESEHSPPTGLLLEMSHLQRALATTRPSISTADIKFYRDVHARFRQSWKTDSQQDQSPSFPAADMGDDVTKQRVTFK